MAYFAEPGRQNVQKEAAHKFDGFDGHNFLLAAIVVVAPLERYVSILFAKDTVVGDGDAMCITTLVIHHFLRPAEGRLAIKNPIYFVQACKQGAEV